MEWLKENSSPEAVICSQVPEYIYIVSGRKSVQFTHSNNHGAVLQSLTGQNVDYVLVDRLSYGGAQQYLVPVLDRYPNRFVKVFELESPGTFVYKINKP